MHDSGSQITVIIVAAVLLFFFLGIAILVIIDHKARLPGGFTSNPFSIMGLRRDHPFLGFFTATLLTFIITALILELAITLFGAFTTDQTDIKQGLMSSLEAERSAESVRRFHNFPDKFLPTQGKKNVCLSCHGFFPHSKKPMIRSMLNMHTQYIGCVTCHSDPDKADENEIKLRWLNFSGIKVTGPPFGTDIDPDSGELVKTDDYYSRIVAYRINGDQETIMEITADHPEMVEYEKIKDSFTDRDREAFKKRFHKNIMSKGRFCSRCHTNEAESFIPFRELGFSDRRIQDLTNLNIIGLVEKYKDFYMPDLLRSQKPGDKRSGMSTGDNKAMKGDPRSWWKKKYDNQE